MIDGTKQPNVWKFKWAQLRGIIRGVSKNWATQRICNWRSAELSGIVPWFGSRSIGNLVVWLIVSVVIRAPRRYFSLSCLHDKAQVYATNAISMQKGTVYKLNWSVDIVRVHSSKAPRRYFTFSLLHDNTDSTTELSGVAPESWQIGSYEWTAPPNQRQVIYLLDI